MVQFSRWRLVVVLVVATTLAAVPVPFYWQIVSQMANATPSLFSVGVAGPQYGTTGDGALLLMLTLMLLLMLLLS